MMRAALTGTAVALLCLVPPLIHFVTGPLGPFIGGVVAGAQLRSRTDSTFALILMSALMAVMLAGAFTVIVGAAVVIISLFIETDTQFGLAREEGEAYWLYVVEHAGTDGERIVPIQNPAGRDSTYTFDHGWRAAAEGTEGDG